MKLINLWLKITGRTPVPMIDELMKNLEPAKEESLICGQLVEVLGPSPSLVGAQGRIIHDFKNGDLFEVYIPKFSAGYILKRENLKPIESFQ